MTVTRRGFLSGMGATLGSLAVPGAWAQDIADPQASQFGFGWEPDGLIEEERLDLPFRANLPSKLLLKNLPDVYNQGKLNSCVANAVGAGVQVARLVNKHTPDFVPSRHFVYYYARKATGTEAFDRGSRISNAIKVVRTLGVCPETVWPYDNIPGSGPDRRFPPGARGGIEPDAAARQAASPHVVIEWAPITVSAKNVRSALAFGFPVIFGFQVYTNMFGKSGPVDTLRLPTSGDQKISGHAVAIVGYDDDTRMFRIRNSWGDTVHQRGYYDMAYDYVLNTDYSFDFWTITDTAGMTDAN